MIGDRQWVQSANGTELTPPVPFLQMPLTWERAFGGAAEVWLDESSPAEVMHTVNPRGRGFDPSDGVENLGRQLYVAPDFPRTAYRHVAPNLESLHERIGSPTDAPEPLCFAPAPPDVTLSAVRWAQRHSEQLETDPRFEFPAEVLSLRAHPDLVFARAPLGQPVCLRGCHPRNEYRFVLPEAVPLMDYVLGDRNGTRELIPQALVLLPEEERFYIVYRRFFLMRPDEGEERSVRLRFE